MEPRGGRGLHARCVREGVLRRPHGGVAGLALRAARVPSPRPPRCPSHRALAADSAVPRSARGAQLSRSERSRRPRLAERQARDKGRAGSGEAALSDGRTYLCDDAEGATAHASKRVGRGTVRLPRDPTAPPRDRALARTTTASRGPPSREERKLLTARLTVWPGGGVLRGS